MLDNLFFSFFILLLSILFLWKGAEWLVDSACKLAEFFQVPPVVVGLTIVAIGTSAPEFAVSIQAALQGKAAIAVGNVFGSNIFNLGFILGLAALFSPMKTDKQTVYGDALFLFFSALFFYFLSFQLSPFSFFPLQFSLGYLHPISSFFLLLLLLGYIFFLYWKRKEKEQKKTKKKFFASDLFFLFLGLFCIILGGHYLVESGIKIGEYAGLSTWVIGITIVAIGTSAPELVTTLVALAKKKQSIAIGSLLGSDLFNLLGVIGVAGMISGGISLPLVAHFSLLMLLVNLSLVFFFLRTNWKLTRMNGIFLILFSIFRYYLDFTISI